MERAEGAAAEVQRGALVARAVAGMVAVSMATVAAAKAMVVEVMVAEEMVMAAEEMVTAAVARVMEAADLRAEGEVAR